MVSNIVSIVFRFCSTRKMISSILSKMQKLKLFGYRVWPIWLDLRISTFIYLVFYSGDNMVRVNMMGNLFSKNRKYDFRPEVCLRNIFFDLVYVWPRKVVRTAIYKKKNDPMVLTLTKAKKAKMKNTIDQAVFYHVWRGQVSRQLNTMKHARL